MNGFKMTADGYRQLVAKGKLKEEDVKREIEVYDFLGTCDSSDFCRLVNSAAFNDIIKAYCRKALKGAGMDEDTEDRVMDELRWLLDTKNAKEILE